MKRRIIITLIIGLSVMVLSYISSKTSGISVASEVPKLVNYQGKLTDSEGNPLTGNFSMTFAIYDAEVGGNRLWGEGPRNVSVAEGLFSVLMGEVNPIPIGVFDGNSRWLEVKVEGETMDKRKRMVSVGYAFRAEKSGHAALADEALQALAVSDNSITSPKILDGEVISDDIANNAVTTSKLQDSAVTTGKVSDRAVTNPKLGADSVTNDKIQNGTIKLEDIGFTVVSAVTAGNGLTGGGSGEVTLNVGTGTGISVNADAVSLTTNYADGSAYDNRFVNVTGDTMTGDLHLNGNITVTGAVDGYDLSEYLKYGQYFIDSAGSNGHVWTSNGSGRGSWKVVSGDNLGNHTATQNIKLNGHWLSNDGGNEGVYVTTDGRVGISNISPSTRFHVGSTGSGVGSHMTVSNADETSWVEFWSGHSGSTPALVWERDKDLT